MLRSILAAPVDPHPLDPQPHDPQPHDPQSHGSQSPGPDAGPAPAQDRPVDSVARPARQHPDRGTVSQRFAARRNAEATYRIWRSAAVGGGPGLR